MVQQGCREDWKGHTPTALPSSQHYFSISSGIHLEMGGKWLRITTHSDLATTGLLRWSSTPIYSIFDGSGASFIALVSIVLIGYQVHIAKAWPLHNENAVSANKSHKNDDFCFTLVSYKFADWLGSLNKIGATRWPKFRIKKKKRF